MRIKIFLLNRKTALVAELRNFNDMAENEPVERRTELFGQEYGWTVIFFLLWNF